jgi:hypothetical protein
VSETDGEAHYIFLSYALADQGIATALANDLRLNGVHVSVGGAALHSGESWAQAIKRSLLYADAVLVLVSPVSIESHWVREEWSYALIRSQLVIPIIVGGGFELLTGPLAEIQGLVYEPGTGMSLQPLLRSLEKLKSPSPTPIQTAVAEGQVGLSAQDVERIVKMTIQQVMHRESTSHSPESDLAVRGDLVFVISSFSPDMDPVFDAINSAATAVKLRAQRVKDVPGDYRLTDKILTMITEARFVVADLTHERPNVYFELGFARGLGKRVVTIIKDTSSPHFDVQDWTYIRYADSRPLEDELRRRFKYELGVDQPG